VLSEPQTLPHGVKAASLKFIFTNKVGECGKVARYKARMLVNLMPGEQQEEEMVYSPVVEQSSMRIFMAVVA
jgi:hypothetical protein